MPEAIEPPGQILRDYLYVDVDKVKSIAGQLESGVPEESRLTTRDARRTTMGWKGILSYSPESGDETHQHRSMLDSLFPELEEILEQGWLQDISDVFHSTGGDKFSRIRELCPEGSLFRLTADGYLFDVRYFASLFSSVSVAMAGHQDLERAKEELAKTDDAKRTGSKSGGQRNQPDRGRPKSDEARAEKLEDAVEPFAPQHGMTPAFFRSMVRTARGVFSPGMNLLMSTNDVTNRVSISAVLQENRRYFDASPDVIATRFGVSPQRWTLVGTVGHYSPEPEQAGRQSLAMSVENAIAGDFNRNRFVRTINSTISAMAATGLTELPQYPGMAAIPIAVYRSVRWTSPGQ